MRVRGGNDSHISGYREAEKGDEWDRDVIVDDGGETRGMEKRDLRSVESTLDDLDDGRGIGESEVFKGLGVL